MIRKILRRLKGGGFEGSSKYWENRYKQGGHSGSGSQNELAQFKADYINSLVESHGIDKVIEFGCGDGQQLELYKFRKYTGLDVSKTVVNYCKKKFSENDRLRFELYVPETFEPAPEFDLSMSIDVLYHLIEDEVFDTHIDHLFGSSKRLVLIYSCDFDDSGYGAHVKPRKFTQLVAERYPNFELKDHTINPFPLDELGPEKGSWSDFYLFEKTIS